MVLSWFSFSLSLIVLSDNQRGNIFLRITGNVPIMEYIYQDGNDKKCSVSDAEKTLARYYNSPVGFLIASLGGDGSRVHIVGKDGKRMNNNEAVQQSIPYKPLEIK